MKLSRNDILFFISLLLAVWFVLFGMIWMYWAALIIAYPAGLLSYLIFKAIRSDNKKRNKVIPIILAIGLILSVIVLIGLLITN